MTSASSSKKEEDLIFTFGDTGKPHTLPVPILMLLWLSEKCLDYGQRAIKSDWALPMRKAAGALSCTCVAVYVAGYTCGYWVHRLNDRIARMWSRNQDS